ncbi:exodeoxyribonuclease VII large subunit, partial [Isoptericola sp. QY 916]|nr:exodeoxyribonuclease VII large subunit [Isoptericola sp. QY 916]
AALLRASGEVGRLAAQVRALSPQATLERGYAVVQRADGHVVRASHDVTAGDAVHVRVAEGSLEAAVTATAAPAPPA